MCRFGFLALLALVSTPASAEDLLCTGTFWTAGGQSGEMNKVLFFDAASLHASTDSFRGDVSGTLKAKPTLYLGWLRSGTGADYWVTLDRYTGQFVMMVWENDQDQHKAEFSGICRRAERKF